MLSDEEIHGIFYPMGGASDDQLQIAMGCARAIESAATAPLLARIAELEAANEAFGKRQEWWNARMLELEQQLEEARKDAERYRFIRDADRSDCITQELSLYAMETLDEYVDAAMEGEAELAIRAAIKEQT